MCLTAYALRSWPAGLPFTGAPDGSSAPVARCPSLQPRGTCGGRRRPGGALKLVVHLAGQDVAGPPWQSGPARDHPQFVGALLDLVRCRVGVSLGTDDGQVGVQEQAPAQHQDGLGTTGQQPRRRGDDGPVVPVESLGRLRPGRTPADRCGVRLVVHSRVGASRGREILRVVRQAGWLGLLPRDGAAGIPLRAGARGTTAGGWGGLPVWGPASAWHSRPSLSLAPGS